MASSASRSPAPGDAGGVAAGGDRLAAAVGALSEFLGGRGEASCSDAAIDGLLQAVVDAALVGGHTRDAIHATFLGMLQHHPGPVSARVVRTRAAIDRFAGLLPPLDTRTDPPRR